jgi:hypothetical protein
MSKINKKNLIFFGLGLSFVLILSILIFLPTTTKAYYFVGWENGTYVGYSIDMGNYNDSNGSNNSNYNYDGNNYNYNYNGNGNNMNPIPSVISVSPNSGKINTNTVITVSGNDFVRGSSIRINNSNISTTFINSGTLRGQLNSYDLNSKGDYLISVFNPTPGGGFSNAVTFTAIPNVISSTTTTSKTSVAKTSTSASTKKSTPTDTTTKSDNGTQVKELAAGAIFGYNGFMPSSLLQWLFFFIFILLVVVLWRKLYVSESERSTPLKHA